MNPHGIIPFNEPRISGRPEIRYDKRMRHRRPHGCVAEVRVAAYINFRNVGRIDGAAELKVECPFVAIVACELNKIGQGELCRRVELQGERSRFAGVQRGVADVRNESRRAEHLAPIERHESQDGIAHVRDRNRLDNGLAQRRIAKVERARVFQSSPVDADFNFRCSGGNQCAGNRVLANVAVVAGPAGDQIVGSRGNGR